jgi:hypothetical protein
VDGIDRDPAPTRWKKPRFLNLVIAPGSPSWSWARCANTALSADGALNLFDAVVAASKDSGGEAGAGHDERRDQRRPRRRQTLVIRPEAFKASGPLGMVVEGKLLVPCAR